MQSIAKHLKIWLYMVVYRGLYGEHNLWVRPLSMWNEVVVHNGIKVKRFTHVDDLKNVANEGINKYSPSQEKVELFMELFGSRNDVYAKRWESKKGNCGYSPECINEWSSLCPKTTGTKMKCTDCAHKSFEQLSPSAIEKHLNGQITIGIYPMDSDETCKFLAIDFDGDNFKKDILAVSNVCHQFNIFHGIERSRSGNGAHLWVFFRISTLPSQWGENVVLRVLDKAAIKFDLKEINFSEENYKKFLKMIMRKEGIVLMTGPTGSGKSTTLYCSIVFLNDESVSISTLENPIEYDLYGIIQSQVNEKTGFTFKHGLENILRQDPEITLIGEIRDEKTAETAISASNTGHLVLSTIHSINAVGVVLRFFEWNIPPFMVASTLSGVVSQRLLRSICPKCKTSFHLEKDSPYRKVLKSDEDIMFYKGIGCKECFNTGYKGRVAVHEIFVIDEEIQELIMTKPSIRQLSEIAVKNGMQSMLDDALEKAKQGLTTLDEVHRVIHFDL